MISSKVKLYGEKSLFLSFIYWIARTKEILIYCDDYYNYEYSIQKNAVLSECFTTLIKIIVRDAHILHSTTGKWIFLCSAVAWWKQFAVRLISAFEYWKKWPGLIIMERQSQTIFIMICRDCWISTWKGMVTGVSDNFAKIGKVSSAFKCLVSWSWERYTFEETWGREKVE